MLAPPATQPNVACLQSCEGCPFGGAKVGSRGPLDAKVVIVGESPGHFEVRAQQPFVGPSGDILTQGLRGAGLNPEEILYTNAMQCFPGYTEDKNETSLAQAAHLCQARLYQEIQAYPREVILALGSPALWSLTNNFELKITQERGKVFDTPHLPAKHLIPSIHPSFLMRGGPGATTRQFKQDLSYAQALTNGKPRKVPPKTTFEVATSPYQINRWRNLLKQQVVRAKGRAVYVAADAETGDFSPYVDGILCVGFAPTPSHVYIIPERFIPWARLMFVDGVEYIWHNGKFDIRFLHHYNIPQARVDHDTMLLSYATDEYGGVHDLEQVASDYLNSLNWKAMVHQYLPKRKKDQPPPSYRLVPRDTLHEYMAYDIGNTRAIFDVLYPQVCNDRHLSKLYHRLLIPASNMLARVEMNGLYVDTQRVEENRIYYEGEDGKGGEIGKLLAEFNAIVHPLTNGRDVNPNSSVQMCELLFDILHFKLPKGKRSTDKRLLERLPPHPILKLLRQIRAIKKSLGTYVLSIAKKKRIQSDGKIHTTLKLHATVTGRLASEEPNLQNQPRDPRLRGQYIATPGRRIVAPDLNQAELRVLAEFSGDPELYRIYTTAGMSLHDEVSKDNFGNPKEWSSSDIDKLIDRFNIERNPATMMRALKLETKMRAKNINFGMIYGIAPPSLAEQCYTSVPEAIEFQKRWKARFPVAWDYIEQCRNAPIKGQTLITPLGRKRRFGVVSRERMHDIMNQASNFPEQSCASDFVLDAAIQLETELRTQYNAKIVLLVHDELLIEVDDDDDTAMAVGRRACEVMQEIPRKWGLKRIPFVAEMKWGYRWGSLEEKGAVANETAHQNAS